MAKRPNTGERRLLNLTKHRVVSSLSSTDNNGVCYFDQAWLGGKPLTFSRRTRSVTKEKDLPRQVFFVFVLSQKIVE